jgi:hypothetical protein
MAMSAPKLLLLLFLMVLVPAQFLDDHIEGLIDGLEDFDLDHHHHHHDGIEDDEGYDGGMHDGNVHHDFHHHNNDDHHGTESFVGTVKGTVTCKGCLTAHTVRSDSSPQRLARTRSRIVRRKKKTTITGIRSMITIIKRL